ncbi:hypothetical protein [Stenotrophomonas maltophilia]|uniref:hypothetical protein n=1 Tax=Stenotrophomonas maltophilia TaxID=40324 RepID=UPI0007EF72E7|nr:hypothetical protein [Stenotrophomonas maltophilia]OBU50139.1 hypothetical protein A9K76_07960 [Stenotrophomonas maltophilia]
MTNHEDNAHCLWCFNCGEASPTAGSAADSEDLAGLTGWKVGLDSDGSGAAQYACPDCSPLLHDANPVRSLAAMNADLPGGAG